MLILTKEITEANKTVTVVNIPQVMFIGGNTKQGRTGNIQRDWHPERLVAVINTMGVLVEEALADIVMKDRKVVINMECDGIVS